MSTPTSIAASLFVVPGMRPQASVLLVEDIEVLQIVTGQMLIALGCEVTVAGDGSGAMENLSRRDFDLILMDLQLPDIDGAELSRRVRRAESAHRSQGRSGLSGVPIVALTADEQSNARDDCLAAGMNDFLAKPVSIEQLNALLRRWLGEAGGAGAVAMTPRPSAGVEPKTASSSAIERKVLDGIRAMQKPNSADLVARVVQSYISRAPQLLEQIKNGLRAGDAVAVQEAAHALKSSSANLGAVNLAKESKALEHLALVGALDDGPRLVDELCNEYRAVRAELLAEIAEPSR